MDFLLGFGTCAVLVAIALAVWFVSVLRRTEIQM